jgi:hypothetical protein
MSHDNEDRPQRMRATRSLRGYSAIWITERGISSLRLAKMRHLDKSRTWIANKYWHHKRSRKWVFSTKKNRLKLFSDTKIVISSGLELDMNQYINVKR